MASLEPVARSREAGELSCCILGTMSRPAAGRTRTCCVSAAGRGWAGLSLTGSIFKETPVEGGAKRKNTHSSVCHAQLLQLLQLQLPGTVFRCQLLPGIGGLRHVALGNTGSWPLDLCAPWPNWKKGASPHGVSNPATKKERPTDESRRALWKLWL